MLKMLIMYTAMLVADQGSGLAFELPQRVETQVSPSLAIKFFLLGRQLQDANKGQQLQIDACVKSGLKREDEYTVGAQSPQWSALQRGSSEAIKLIKGPESHSQSLQRASLKIQSQQLNITLHYLYW
ncbi:hypothetical protein EON63_15720 [archaeon]|nr:MAG: hypothetical protein EON63_15720 [archaeon]